MADVISALEANVQSFNDGDWDRYAETMTDDVEYFEPATQRTVNGRDAEIELSKGWKESFPDATGTITSIFSSGDRATAEITWTGTHSGDMEGPAGMIPATGKRVKLEACMTVIARDGKIRTAHHYFDMLTMLVQIGALPEPTMA